MPCIVDWRKRPSVPGDPWRSSWMSIATLAAAIRPLIQAGSASSSASAIAANSSSPTSTGLARPRLEQHRDRHGDRADRQRDQADVLPDELEHGAEREGDDHRGHVADDGDREEQRVDAGTAHGGLELTS